MRKRLFFALPLVVLGLVAGTESAMAAFDPSRDELAIGTALIALGVMVLLLLIYGVIWYFDLNHPGDPDIPDHEHDHRYAHEHHE